MLRVWVNNVIDLSIVGHRLWARVGDHAGITTQTTIPTHTYEQSWVAGSPNPCEPSGLLEETHTGTERAPMLPHRKLTRFNKPVCHFDITHLHVDSDITSHLWEILVNHLMRGKKKSCVQIRDSLEESVTSNGRLSEHFFVKHDSLVSGSKVPAPSSGYCLFGVSHLTRVSFPATFKKIYPTDERQN